MSDHKEVKKSWWERIRSNPFAWGCLGLLFLCTFMTAVPVIGVMLAPIFGSWSVYSIILLIAFAFFSTPMILTVIRYRKVIGKNHPNTFGFSMNMLRIGLTLGWLWLLFPPIHSHWVTWLVWRLGVLWAWPIKTLFPEEKEHDSNWKLLEWLDANAPWWLVIFLWVFWLVWLILWTNVSALYGWPRAL